MRIEELLEYNPILLALLATLFTWALTALGSSMVFFFKTINKKILNSMLGFAAGVINHSLMANFQELLNQ